ncbi:hypothetical protein BC941DRAFT_476862 [Chlamydoabsidia padenii]|nr:hypothetical protein BC941DRAFT_476862 [Chlamydoabsidia padenii]
MSLSATSSPSSHIENDDDLGNELERYCRRCRKSCPVALFAGRRIDYKTCLNCRNRDTAVPVRPDFADLIPIEQLADSFDDTPSPDTDIIFDGHLFIDDGHIDNTDEQFVEAIYMAVEHAGGYRYTKKNIVDPKKRHSRTDVNQQRLLNELARLGRRMTTYDCGGELSGGIYRQQRWLTSGDLFAKVQRQFWYNISRAQVYYWKSQAPVHHYKCADYQMESSRILVREYRDADFRERIMTLVNNGNNDNYSSDYLTN